MFFAALFKIFKILGQPMCPFTNKWIKKMWCIHIYKEGYYSS